MKHILFLSLIFATSAHATFSTSIEELDPAKSKAPFCLSKLIFTKGPGQLHTIGAMGRKGNDTFTYELIDNQINKIADTECSDPVSKKSSNDIITSINDTCTKSCESDEVKNLFTRKNTQGAIGSANLAEFQTDCRLYCRIANSFRTTLMQEKTYEGLQVRAILMDNKKMKTQAGITTETIPGTPAVVTPVRTPPTSVPAGDKLPPAAQGQMKK